MMSLSDDKQADVIQARRKQLQIGGHNYRLGGHT